MKKRILAVVTGGVWVAAIGSAVALTYALNRPVALRDVTSSSPSRWREVDGPRQFVEPAMLEPEIEEMPAVLVLGNLRTVARGRGVAEMQPMHEVIIGPGVVTSAPQGTREVKP